jgi:hypothetical protein
MEVELGHELFEFRLAAGKLPLRLSAISALSRPIVSLVLPISASWLVVLDFICSTQISSRRVATAICEWTWSMSASMAAITGGGMDWRRRTAERLARMRMAATVPTAINKAKRNPIPRSMIGSLITMPRTPATCYLPCKTTQRHMTRALVVAVAGWNQATIHVAN